MRRIRFSIAGLMAFSLVIALECVALRVVATWRGADEFLELGLLPMLNLLALGLFLIARQVRTRGESQPFLLGFEVIGWPVVMAFALIAMTNETLILKYIEFAAAPIERVFDLLDADYNLVVWQALSGLFVAIILFLPQALLALAGGWITQKLGLVITRRALPPV
ncbi:MAG TPA: hypothetical protein VGZ22_05260 [Isosphaeraceae bacterium]|jgi:hypothetical protein|nr:hypothetical protein [Isosphaeraceae bacterium]